MAGGTQGPCAETLREALTVPVKGSRGQNRLTLSKLPTWATCRPPLVCANKVLLKQGHACSFVSCGCVHATVAEASGCDSGCRACKALGVSIWPLKKQRGTPAQQIEFTSHPSPELGLAGCVPDAPVWLRCALELEPDAAPRLALAPRPPASSPYFPYLGRP